MSMGTIAAVVGTVAGVAGILQGERAASDARDASEAQAREEARLEGIVTEERVRQLEVEQQVMEGRQRATAAASGVELSGSVLDILDEQAKNYQHEITATQRAGASRAAGALQRGQAIGREYQARARANSYNQAANIFTQWANYNQSRGG